MLAAALIGVSEHGVEPLLREEEPLQRLARGRREPKRLRAARVRYDPEWLEPEDQEMAGCRNGAGAARRRSGSRYRARIADNADWGRPDLVTARKIGALVGVNADTMLRMPKDPDGDTAARAFVVALDYVISLGD